MRHPHRTIQGLVMTNPDLLGDRREQPVPGPDHATPDAVPELPQAASLAPGAAPGQTPADYSTPPMPSPQVPPPAAVATLTGYSSSWLLGPGRAGVVACSPTHALPRRPPLSGARRRAPHRCGPRLPAGTRGGRGRPDPGRGA